MVAKYRVGVIAEAASVVLLDGPIGPTGGGDVVDGGGVPGWRVGGLCCCVVAAPREERAERQARHESSIHGVQGANCRRSCHAVPTGRGRSDGGN